MVADKHTECVIIIINVFLLTGALMMTLTVDVLLKPEGKKKTI